MAATVLGRQLGVSAFLVRRAWSEQARLGWHTVSVGLHRLGDD